MKNKFSLLLIFILLLSLSFPVLAQSQEGVTLRMTRDFGYSSLGSSQIQGTFTLHVTGPASLTRVDFYIDETKIGDLSQAPFNLRFVTDNYPLGMHRIYAVGFQADGTQTQSNQIQANFVSASTGVEAGLRIAIPVLGLVLLFMLLSFGVTMVLNRGKSQALAPGTPRNYGIRGGAICPKCGRPFVLSLFGLHLLTYRLDHCPYCGKWSLVRTASLDNLRSAEAAELAEAQKGAQIPEESAEDKLHKELDDSRFQDS